MVAQCYAFGRKTLKDLMKWVSILLGQQINKNKNVITRKIWILPTYLLRRNGIIQLFIFALFNNTKIVE